MGAVNLAQNPNALREEAALMRGLTERLPKTELLCVRLNAMARELDDTADAIEMLSPEQRADLIEMLKSIAPN